MKEVEDALRCDHAEGQDTISGAHEELQAVSDQCFMVGPIATQGIEK